MMKISPRWKKKAEIYKLFTRGKRIRWFPDGKYEIYEHTIDNIDFSNDAKEQLYLWESQGKGNLKENIFENKINGYVLGKKMMDITIMMWKQDILEGLLFTEELYKEKEFPTWWLDGIFGKRKPINIY